MGRTDKNPRAEATAIRPVAVTLRGSAEWKAWVERLARHCRMTNTTVIDHALVHYARHVGFEEPAPER